MNQLATDEIAPWTEVPDAVWHALRAILKPYAGVTFEVPGDPVPKKRRVGQGRAAFTPTRTRNAEKSVARAFSDVMPGWEPEPDLTYGVMVELTTEAGSKVDVDNGLKLVMDALNKKLWLDDIQVGATFTRIVRGRGDVGTKVMLFAMKGNGTPLTKVCACGTRYRAKTPTCADCRNKRKAVNQVLAIESAETSDAEFARLKRRVFRAISIAMMGRDTSPSTKVLAAALGITESRARAAVNALIADDVLARDGRKLRVKNPMGAVA